MGSPYINPSAQTLEAHRHDFTSRFCFSGSLDKFNNMFKEMDLDANKSISLEEFRAYAIKLHPEVRSGV